MKVKSTKVTAKTLSKQIHNILGLDFNNLNQRIFTTHIRNKEELEQLKKAIEKQLNKNEQLIRI